MALPLAMVLMVSLTALALAFSVLASTEPTIASNHSMTSKARSLAESGVERASWALFNAALTGGIPADQVPALTPYDGANYFSVGTLGGFTVQVAAGGIVTERTVTAVGWSPNNTAAVKAHRKVQTILEFTTATVRVFDPPCALCVAGNVQIGGNARVESRSGGCGTAVPPGSAVRAAQTVTVSGSGDVYGHGNDTRNEANIDWQQGANPAAFTYTPAELARLKEMAKQQGTYYQGARTSLPASGIVYIDTLDGSEYTADTPDALAGSLTIASNGTFNGIVIVAGSIFITGTNTFDGLIYALNDLTATAGNVTINGAVASENRKDTSSTTVDSAITGSVAVNYDCEKVRNFGGTVIPVWTIKPGTYREIAGS
ncbi:MAG: hypothetical protein WED01_11220 [Candidatus Rokuibacteriota bacterium]